ncbi:nucleotidyltransferase family protein [Candidatus Latescibacterota bacterium]
MTATFDTRILDATLRRQREGLEAERIQVLDRVRRALLAVRDRHGIASAYIIGSLLRPYGWHRHSDVDVAVGGCSHGILEVMAALEEATGREADVVDLDRHPCADSFTRSGLCIYG